jgi:hypothetical protein
MLSSLHGRSLLQALLLGVLVQCSGPSSSARTGLDFGPGPPPRPGSSLYQTRMCECVSCQPRACCAGPDETQASCDLSQVESSTAADELDFGRAEDCGIEVRSCTGSCGQQVWRVASTESCASRRPASCCN